MSCDPNPPLCVRGFAPVRVTGNGQERNCLRIYWDACDSLTPNCGNELLATREPGVAATATTPAVPERSLLFAPKRYGTQSWSKLGGPTMWAAEAVLPECASCYQFKGEASIAGAPYRPGGYLRTVFVDFTIVDTSAQDVPFWSGTMLQGHHYRIEWVSPTGDLLEGMTVTGWYADGSVIDPAGPCADVYQGPICLPNPEPEACETVAAAAVKYSPNGPSPCETGAATVV
jgi:hypothetical protein